MNKRVIVILGPTGAGKTKLSIEVAKRLNGEIINGDSTQVYKGLDIATAKVTDQEKEFIPHHLFDIKNIDENYSVFDYQKDCRNKIEDILNRGKVPIIVGGTGLYIKAALYNYEFDLEVEHRDYSDRTDSELYSELKNIDSNTSIHPNNRKRIERALDYYYTNNKVLSDKEKSDKILYDAIFIGLTTDRELLYNRINNRVDIMIENGLIEEARNLYNLNIRTKAIMTPIGYKELFEYFDGNMSLEASIQLIKQRSRNYAKRQYTWNRHQMNINWFDVNFDNFDLTVNNVINFINSKLD